MKKLIKGCKVAKKLQRLQPAKLNPVLRLTYKVARLHTIYKNKVITSLYIGGIYLGFNRLSCAALKYCNLATITDYQ